MTEELRKEIEAAAFAHSCLPGNSHSIKESRVAEIAFTEGAEFGYKLRSQYEHTLTIEHGPADMMKKLEKAEAVLKEISKHTYEANPWTVVPSGAALIAREYFGGRDE